MFNSLNNLRILIAHPRITELGGAEYLTLQLAIGLAEMGYDVVLAVADEFDASRAERVFGFNLRCLKVVKLRVGGHEWLCRVLGGRMARVRRLRFYIEFFEALEEIKGEYDVVFETQSNFPSPADVAYIHYPMLQSYLSVGKGVLQRLYRWVVKRHVGRIRAYRPGYVLTNSTWTAAVIYKEYGAVARVVYPPVNAAEFKELSFIERNERIVLTMSRYSQEKKLETLLEAAEKLPDYTFYVCGTADSEGLKYVEKLKSLAEERNLYNVVFAVNVAREELRRIMARARFYFHPPFSEPFGISVVEAMAAGLVPLVYRDGGAWTDVVSKVSSMLGYNSINEVVSIIKALDRDYDTYCKLKKRCIELAKRFSRDRFISRMHLIARRVARIKRLAHRGTF